MPYGQLHNGVDPFSIDMNAIRAIAEISHREIMSIERIRCMYCFVRRTLTTKSERKYFYNAHNFLHPTQMGVPAKKSVIFAACMYARRKIRVEW